MTLRPVLALLTLIAASSASATNAPPVTTNTDTAASTTTTSRSTQTTRKVERARPSAPLKPRMIEAPGAALMMIPASYDPSRIGPFAPF